MKPNVKYGNTPEYAKKKINAALEQKTLSPDPNKYTQKLTLKNPGFGDGTSPAPKATYKKP